MFRCNSAQKWLFCGLCVNRDIYQERVETDVSEDWKVCWRQVSWRTRSRGVNGLFSVRRGCPLALGNLHCTQFLPLLTFTVSWPHLTLCHLTDRRDLLPPKHVMTYRRRDEVETVSHLQQTSPVIKAHRLLICVNQFVCNHKVSLSSIYIPPHTHTHLCLSCWGV